jgi:hypothetical protein
MSKNYYAQANASSNSAFNAPQNSSSSNLNNSNDLSNSLNVSSGAMDELREISFEEIKLDEFPIGRYLFQLS